MDKRTGHYLIAALILSLLVVAGFGAKNYDGLAKTWVNNALAGWLYVTFFCYFFYLVFRRAKIHWLCFWVFAGTTFVEFTQLLHTPVLEEIRNTYTGRALIGSTFNPMDITWYAVGAFCGYGLIIGHRKLIQQIFH